MYIRYTFEREDGTTYTITSRCGLNDVRERLAEHYDDVLVMACCDCHA